MAVQEHLRIELRRDQDLAILELDGELDLASAPLFQTELDSQEVAAAAKLLIDLRQLSFIDSTGLRVLFSAQSQARQRGQRFAVTRGSEQVQRLLAITRMGEHLDIVEGAEELRS